MIISGIYQIECLPTKDCYIGASKAIYCRWNSHVSDLQANRHKNKKLQRLWTEHSYKNFDLSILQEVIQEKDLLEQESNWMMKLLPSLNIDDNGLIRGVYQAGKKVPDQTVRLIRSLGPIVKTDVLEKELGISLTLINRIRAGTAYQETKGSASREDVTQWLVEHAL